MSIEGRTLRAHLKSATSAQHDALDLAISDMALTDGAPYAHFLAVQYAARAFLETRFADTIDEALIPPPQLTLIAADLADLGYPPPGPVGMAWPGDADGLGLAWVLAGSSLGNKALLQRRRKLGLSGPERFLSDPRMPRFFRDLLPRLAAPATDEHARKASLAASAAFSAFEHALVQQDVWCKA